MKSVNPRQGHIKSSMVSRLVIGTLTLMAFAGVAAGWLAYNSMIETKRNDGWALNYLEWENRAYLLGNSLRERGVTEAGGQNTETAQKPEFLARWDGKKVDIVSGTIINIKPSIVRSLFNQGQQFAVHQLDGRPFLLRPISYDMVDHYFPGLFPFATYIAAWPLSLSDFLLTPDPGAKFKAYVVTGQGLLLSSSSPSVTPANLSTRIPVKKFLSQPLKKGSFEFKDKAGKSWVGVHVPVPDSNLIVFAEFPRNFISVTPVLNQLGNFGLAYLGTMALFFGLILVLRVRFMHDLQRLVSRILNTAPGDDDPELKDLRFAETTHIARAWMTSKHHYLGILSRVSQRSPVIAEMEVHPPRSEGSSSNKEAS